MLDTKQRVLTTRGLSRAFGYRKTGTDNTKTGAPQLPPFLASKAISRFISAELVVRLNSQIEFRPMKGGRTAHGYDCMVLPDVCRAIVAAQEAGALGERRASLAKLALAIREALIGVGMVALVDEATGYQEDRPRDALQQILAAYVLPVMQPWLKRFPPDFFREAYRIMGWKYDENATGSTRGPRFIGKVINECIYKRLPPPVLPKLNELNPSINGRRRHKHHQHLTEHTGIPHLDKQIVAVTVLMRAARDRRQFNEMLVRAFPVTGDQMPLDLAE